MGNEASRLPNANEITLYKVYCLASFVVGYFGVPCLSLKIISMVDLDNFIWFNCPVVKSASVESNYFRHVSRDFWDVVSKIIYL